MLQAMRNKAGSWIVKILFAGFIALIVLSFAIWGIGDVFHGGGPDQTVAEVDGAPISVNDVDRTLRREVDALRRFGGGALSVEQAVALGLHHQVLASMVDDALIDREAGALGLALPDSYIAAWTREQPAFRDPVTGRFDRQTFLSVLASNQLSEAAYVAGQKRQIVRDWVQTGVQLGAAVPRSQAEALVLYRQEQRVADSVSLPFDAVTDVGTPTPQDLQAYHRDNPAAFTAPEYRRLTVLAITPEDLVDEVVVPDADVAQEYEVRRREFIEPERRSFLQAVVTDEEEAQRIAEAAQGRDVGLNAAVAAEAPEVQLIELDSMTSNEMLAPELAEAGFALPVGAVSDPVESPFGWHVLEVTAVQEGVVRPLSEVRTEVERDLKLRAAGDVAFELSQTMLDELARGVPLETVADTLNLPLRRVSVVRAGTTPDGEEPTDLPAPAEVTEVAFALGVGQESDLEEADGDIFFIVRVDEVVAPTLRPLADVEAAVRDDWAAAQRRDAARTAAEQVADRLRAGDEPAEAAATVAGAVAGRIEPIRRDGNGRGDLPVDTVDELFAAAIGDVVVGETEDAVIVARLAAIEQPAVEAAEIDAVAADIRGAVAGDLLSQFVRGLGDRYDVEFRLDELDRYYAVN